VASVSICGGDQRGVSYRYVMYRYVGPSVRPLSGPCYYYIIIVRRFVSERVILGDSCIAFERIVSASVSGK